MSARIRRGLADLAGQGVALLLALLFLLPLIWMLGTALRPTGLVPPRSVVWLYLPPAWENFARIFSLAPLGPQMLNALRITAIAVPVTIITASWAGLAMALTAGAVRRRLLVLSVVLLLVPGSALWLARYAIFHQLGLLNSHWALIIPAYAAGSPLFVLLFYWAFRRLPADLYAAARCDGAGALELWAFVALPAVRPTVAAVLVLAFSLFWGDFIGPLLYLKSERLYTLPVGVQMIAQMDRSQWPLLMASACLLMAPPVLLFGLAQMALRNE